MNNRAVPRIVIALAVVIVSAFAGCQRPTLMPTPEAFATDAADPFLTTHPDKTGTTVPVFIATDRARGYRATPGTPQPWDRFYSKKRSDAIVLARAEVEIGDAQHDWEQLVAASRQEKRAWKPPVRFLGMHEYGLAWSAHIPDGYSLTRDRHSALEATLAHRAPEQVEAQRAFIDDLNAQLARSERKVVYIFVHGFNTLLIDNTNLAASLWHYLGREGAMVSFEWTSRGSVFAYSKDKAAARAAVLHFRLFLRALHLRTDAERIHILAHSAGSPVVVSALKEMRLIHSESPVGEIPEWSKIGRVALAAPDMDLLRFRGHVYDGFDQVPEQTLIYTSSRDKALNFSSMIYGFARLGSPDKALDPKAIKSLAGSTTLQAVDIAEAEKHHGGGLGHSYWHHDPWVSSDLIMYLRHGATPEERGLERGGMENAFWVFPPEYREIVPELAREVYGQQPREEE